jgi:hypothetical protein
MLLLAFCERISKKSNAFEVFYVYLLLEIFIAYDMGNTHSSATDVRHDSCHPTGILP